jgi:GT2 family glycosyltransferase
MHVKEIFPAVHVIQGAGNLYWGGGMRLAWDEAVSAGSFDFYLWLNDDVGLSGDAVQIMFDDRDYVLEKFKIDSLVSGCVCCPETKRTTYSGNSQGSLAEPTGVPQSCLYNNGNVVLVSRNIFNKVGNISKEFPHQMGDGDYGLRCRRAGFGCYTSSRFVGTCEINNKPTWYDPHIPLKQRLAVLHAPTGMPPAQRFIFCLRHRGFFSAVLAVVKLYANTFFPRAYFRLKKVAKTANAGSRL